MAISKFLFYVFGEMVSVRGGLVALQVLSTVKKGTTITLSIRFTTTLSIKKNLRCPKGITYNPCPEGCRGSFILKDIISGPFNYVEPNVYLKILMGCVWVNGGRGRDVSCLPITFDY